MKTISYTEGNRFKYSGLDFEITKIAAGQVIFKNVKTKSIDSMDVNTFENLFKSRKAEFLKYYGEKPAVIRRMEIDCKEMMFYQYLPIKLKDQKVFNVEPRLGPFYGIIIHAMSDFKNVYGVERFNKSYVYLTVKRQYVSKKKSMNRPGYHSDGFLTDDVNYIWSDRNPTIFNCSKFNLTLDDEVSLKEMKKQALVENEWHHADNTLLRLDQYNIHKVNDYSLYEGIRTFVKISFSNDKYDLEGNSHNYELDYSWNMKPRKTERNVPQTCGKKV
ncbi:hypothetical protein CLU96_1258 [Chryseobacterium sp. 52]|uniref:hypothetical protein n=1 Tax=Chryseobacterium sp. 52 TaxID=2035213 RepID=UPI000C182A8B|nr:hypothetical protein [Chryseobacterium sp. 52]PIF44315.1 hypothetical protein CLU96_1258 [Chryseobacterium sp. 52]